MQVSILYAFVAGLISFLSPCVLPLVPGYVSMLSGIGVEQLRSGQPPRNSLFASSLAFVLGFSVVFISFGASASAVGQFLLQNKSLMGPVAGAVIILFGLHLVGWLVKISVTAGLIVGGVLLFAAAILWRRSGTETMGPAGIFGSIQFLSVALIFLAGPSLTRWLNRDIRFRNLGGQSESDAASGGTLSGIKYQRLSPGIRVRFRMDAVHRTDSRRGSGAGSERPNDSSRHLAARRLFGRISRPFSGDRSRNQPVPALLSALPAPFKYGPKFLSGALLLFVGALIFVNRLTSALG